MARGLEIRGLVDDPFPTENSTAPYPTLTDELGRIHAGRDCPRLVLDLRLLDSDDEW